MDSTQQPIIYEYAVVRYVPAVHRSEFINVGLVMMSKRCHWMKARLHFNEKRISALAPDADIAAVREVFSLMERTDVPSADLPVEERYRWLTAAKSAVMQVSPSHPGIIPQGRSVAPHELLEKEFEGIFAEQVL